MSDTDGPRVAVVGAGVAGLTAGLYTARNGMETVVVDAGDSILARNAFLENFPGFPAGVGSNRFRDLLCEQARRNGCLLADGSVARLDAAAAGTASAGDPPAADGTSTDQTDAADGEGGDGPQFTLQLEDGDALTADYAVAASWADTAYLDHLPLDFVERGSKRFVDTDRRGRTGIDGLYAAGRVARQTHQAVVAAGHGADVATALLEDSDVPFYHDWVAPEGYFTGRGREVPPGCEEIDGDERRRRERRAREVMQDRFAEPHPDGPVQHPSVDADAYDDI